MTQMTRAWPLVVAAALALLLTEAASTNTSATPYDRAVPLPVTHPTAWTCYYPPGSIEKHCEVLP